MKTSALGPLALLAFMAMLEHSSALPAPDLVQRVPVANPTLPKPSIGHGPVSIPSTFPTPIRPRDGTLQNPHAGTVELPDTAGSSQGPEVQRRGTPICPLVAGSSPPPGCPGGTSHPGLPGSPIQLREVLICPLGTSLGGDGSCHGGTSFGPPIERRDSTSQLPDAGTGEAPDGTSQIPGKKRRDSTGQGPLALSGSQGPLASTAGPPK
jgi:hypothetical protein